MKTKAPHQQSGNESNQPADVLKVKQIEAKSRISNQEPHLASSCTESQGIQEKNPISDRELPS